MTKYNLYLIVILSLLFSCTKSLPKDYAILSGKVINAKANKITIKSRDGYTKIIKLNKNGTFSDTLHLKNQGQLLVFSMDDTGQLFLKNNDDITMTLDANKFKESLSFKGVGAETSNYLAEKLVLQSKFGTTELFKLDKNTFATKAKEISISFNGLLEKYKNIDAELYVKEKEYLKTLPQILVKQYNQIQSQKNKFSGLEGKPSPEFINYENFKGGTTSLKDLRGKYVFIDVWATWCKPCLGEVPHLQKLEEEFKDKNIVFVSISIDRETAKAGWKKMIVAKNMSGIQLFANKKDGFIRAYKINSIPRFILIDPAGIIINAYMSRPSNPKTSENLTKLLK